MQPLSSELPFHIQRDHQRREDLQIKEAGQDTRTEPPMRTAGATDHHTDNKAIYKHVQPTQQNTHTHTLSYTDPRRPG